jgi:integrase/recombinase XerC
MSGRYEKDMQLDNDVREYLKNMPDICTDYYYSLTSAGKSYGTAKTYISRLNQFIKYTFGNDCDDDFYTKIKSTDINKYISSLRTRQVNGRSKRISDSYKTVSWSALNSFFDFLVPEYIKINPVSNTKRPKMQDNPNVTYLTQDEIAQVLDRVLQTSNKRMTNRDLCILKLGFATGLRISAIVQIDMDDLDLKHNKIRVIEKGDTEHHVLIGDNMKKQIMLWLKDRKEYFACAHNNALFVSQEGNRISTRTINDLLTKYTDFLDKRVTPHVMRHSCATNLYEKTGDIYLCAKQLHHKNVSTTQRYAELSQEKQKQAANILDDLI